jgi:hypothetical protein
MSFYKIVRTWITFITFLTLLLVAGSVGEGRFDFYFWASVVWLVLISTCAMIERAERRR